MDAIQKYELVRGEAKTIRLALTAVPVRVAVQEGHLCMWVREPTDAMMRKPRIFVALSTGQTFEREHAYIGTCDDVQHPWHVLEVM